MNVKKYEVIKGPGDFYYEFYSEGPRGTIKKIVRFTPLNDYGKDYYNLFMGDWVETENKISDTSISNNDDREKILATVAAIVIHFTFLMPKAIIFARGSTASRNRLYQMGIATHWSEINEEFDLHGFSSDKWERFQKNRSYEAFLLHRK